MATSYSMENQSKQDGREVKIISRILKGKRTEDFLDDCRSSYDTIQGKEHRIITMENQVKQDGRKYNKKNTGRKEDRIVINRLQKLIGYNPKKRKYGYGKSKQAR